VSTLANVAVIVAAGIGGGAIPLSGLQHLSVEIDRADQGLVFVRMYSDESGKGTGIKCRGIAPKVKARFNGQPLARLTGVYAAGDLQYNRDCLLELAFPGETVHETVGGAYGGRVPVRAGMRMAGPIPAKARSSGPASIRIDEGHTHLALDIPDAFTPRRLVMVSPADGVLRAGQHVQVRWQPPTDDISKAEIALHRPGAPVEQALTILTAGLSIHGELIEFDVPAKVPDHLRGQIEVRLIGTANVQPGFSPCPVDRCEVHLVFDAAPAIAELR
jgi:hypothetical protein